MGSDNAGLDRLTRDAGAPAWDRFAHWPALPARLLLAGLAVLLVLAALTPLTASMDGAPSEVPSLVGANEAAPDEEPERDEDLAFYDRVIERIEGGENYYDFIVEEQRGRNYPVRPGVAVRLPTLAYVHAWLGETGMLALPFLDRVGLVFVLCVALGMAISRLEAADEQPGAIEFSEVDCSTSTGFNAASAAVVLMLIALYATWW